MISAMKVSSKGAHNNRIQGKAMMRELVYSIMQKLRLAGYGIWFLGHTKFKNVKKDGDTEGYDTLASNLNEDLYKNIAQDMDFIMQIKMERIKGADNTEIVLGYPQQYSSTLMYLYSGSLGTPIV
jgi:hypothetical protein